MPSTPAQRKATRSAKRTVVNLVDHTSTAKTSEPVALASDSQDLTASKATRGAVLDQLAQIMDNLERGIAAHRWATHYEKETSWSPSRAQANQLGAQDCHQKIVAAVIQIGIMAMPGHPYMMAELQQRQSVIRAARLG